MKVIRDLLSEYKKNAMMVVAIAIGIFGIGAILGGYEVIQREMSDNYLSSVPASATIEMTEDITVQLLDSVRNFPGIAAADRHATVAARMKVGEKWFPLVLFIVDDFKNNSTNKITQLTGPQEPPLGTMLVERTALVVMQARPDDELMVKTTHGESIKIKIAGTVHDPSLAPAWQEQCGYGYISLSTLQLIGESKGFDQLRILVNDQPYSTEHITKKAREVAERLSQSGHSVHEIQIPPPGKHPHQSQMSAVMMIFIVFSFLILILGSILVSTAMATLMVKHVRQIGIMKSIGAKSRQITGMYVLMIILCCLVALLVAIPLSQLAAGGFYRQIGALLNIEIRDDSIPIGVPLLQATAGIFIPLIAAAFPLFRGSRISVRDALDYSGVSQKAPGKQSWSARIARLSFINETLRLSIRNVFRQRSRLVMTLGLLAAGGAMFMTALNVSEAWNHNLKRIYTQRLYDVELRLSFGVPAQALIDKMLTIPGVKAVEGWSYSPTSIKEDSSFEITHTYPDKGHGSFSIQALPVPTRLLQPTLLKGEWLNRSGSNDVVLNQIARGSYEIGDEISLSINGSPAKWKVIGFTEDVGSPATAYVSQDSYARSTNTAGITKVIRVAYADRSMENAIRMNREVEAFLERQNIEVSASIPVWLLQNAIAAHMKVLVSSLMAMAILMALVGIIGLMSTMSMSILERTREIGVMRAIGATPAKIRRLIVWEGMLIGTMSIVMAFVFSIVLSTYIGRLIGDMAFRTPLPLSIAAFGFEVWLLLIVVGSYVAGLIPARRANRISTREALAYE